MKNLLFITAILMLFSFGCTDDDDYQIPPGNGSGNGNGRPDNEVGMTASTFQPASLTVSTGTTVRWINDSSVAHTVTSNDGLFDVTLQPGEDFSYTFTDAGSYNYVCTIHPGMNGVIVVE